MYAIILIKSVWNQKRNLCNMSVSARIIRSHPNDAMQLIFLLVKVYGRSTIEPRDPCTLYRALEE